MPKLGYRFTAEVSRPDENALIIEEQIVQRIRDEETISINEAVVERMGKEK